MPRRAQPFFRKATGWWYVNVRDARGRRQQRKLVEGFENREAAFQKFHAIMAKRPERRAERTQRGSVLSLLDTFLVSAQQNVAPSTYAWYESFLNDFAGFVMDELDDDDPLKLTLDVDQMRVYHVQQWIDKRPDWGSSTKNGAVGTVRRAFRWAAEQGHIEKYPLFGLRAPAKTTREVILSQGDFKKVVSATKDPRFHDLLTFLLNCGARPQEACRAEIHHVELKSRRIVFPASQAKGKKVPRVVYLNDEALAIVRRLAAGRTEGPLFRNSRGGAWTANAVRQRFKRLAAKVGVRYCAYNFRHTFATTALERGLDSVTVGVLMGHSDPGTVARVYQHLAKKPKHLIEAAKKAR